ncbi:hypothetical protein [Fuscibacter oryzae]|uniref:Phage tail protein n=1 Tax=Fuscibacter oryzae TaxID=2803939 RepID=A0A8J7SVL3_9RHOB|nr:hypothetical protein [Fuscibacter oryzae]MBL4928786.1 hypothetical protein [Fuscibacter oryzae]
MQLSWPSGAGPTYAGSWTEISDLEALGQIGIQWGTTEVSPPEDGSEEDQTVTIKTSRAAQSMQIVFGLNGSDDGQVALWAAAKANADYYFCLVLSDGRTRIWTGPVTSCIEAMDSANSVVKGMATIGINSPITRSA